MPPRYSKSKGRKPAQGSFVDPQMVAQLGDEDEQNNVPSTQEYDYCQYQQQQQQQQQYEYPPYSSFGVARGNTEEETDLGQASAPSRYRELRPTPLRSVAPNNSNSNNGNNNAAAVGSTTSTSYTSTHAKRAAASFVKQQSQTTTQSSSGFGQRDSFSAPYEGMGNSFSQLSPILASPNSLPSVSNASLPSAHPYSSFASLPGSPAMTTASQGLRGVALSGRASAVARSRATSTTANGGAFVTRLSYNSAQQPQRLSATSSTLALSQAYQRLNEGFLMEDNELEFNEALATASLPSTTLMGPQFSASSFSSPVYAPPRPLSNAQSTANASASAFAESSRRGSTFVPAESPLAPLEAAVYGPSDGVVLQFPQFIDFTARVEAMHPFGLEQVLECDVVDATAAAEAPTAAMEPQPSHYTPAENAPVYAPVYAPTQTMPGSAAATAAAVATTAPAASATTGMVVPAPRSRLHGPTSATSAMTMATVDDAPVTTSEVTPDRLTRDAAEFTEDPSPRPHLPPARQSAPNSALRGRADDAAAAQTVHGTPPPAPASALPKRPHAASTASYMREAGEVADAGELSPYETVPHRAYTSSQRHHTSLFTEATTSPAAATAAAPTHKSPSLSPYSAPWAPGTGSMLSTSAMTTTTMNGSTPMTRPGTPEPRPVSATPAGQATDMCGEKSAGACEDAYDVNADDVGGLTLSQKRTAKKQRKQSALKQTQQQQQRCGESCQEDTPSRALTGMNVRTALQQALDEAQADDEEMRVVMPPQHKPAQQQKPTLGNALQALLHQVHEQQQQQQQHQQPQKTARAGEDSAILHALPATPLRAGIASKRVSQHQQQQLPRQHQVKSGSTPPIANCAAIFTRQDAPLLFTVTVVGHLNITLDVFSTAPVEKDTYVLYEADRGEDIGRVLVCTHIKDVHDANGDGANVQVRCLGSFPKNHVPPHVIRPASAGEVHTWLYDQVEEARAALEPCREAVARARLPLTIVDAVYQYNKKKLTFYYDSQERVDFRQLLQTLFSQFHCRIWMEKMPVTA